MRLLFDNNLSQRLKMDLADVYPGSLYVTVCQGHRAGECFRFHHLGLRSCQRLVIVSKDRDYRELSRTRGHPPKVILIDRRNRPNAAVVALLRNSYRDLLSLYLDDSQALLSLD